MTTPDQSRPDEHGRTGGGVRGAINDLLGRGDHADDDRRIDDQHLTQERSDAGHDAGTLDPGSAAHADDGYGSAPAAGAGYGTSVDTGGRADSTVGAAAPQSNQFDDGAGATVPGGARHTDVGPGGPGYDDPQAGGQVQAQRQDIGYEDAGGQNLGRPDAGREDMGQGFDTQPGAEHLHSDAGPAGARTLDTDDPGAEYSARAGSPDRDATDRTGASADTGSNGTARSGSVSVADTGKGEDAEGRERLVSAERAESYSSRWDAVKGEFVDEPRKAVVDADALVGELLDELQTLFTEQRRGIEHSLDADETSTEDMRLALRRYRSFFDRLLSI